MPRHLLSANLWAGLAVCALAGCGQSPADEPVEYTAKKPAAPVEAAADKGRQPVEAEPPATAGEPDDGVRPAAFEQESPEAEVPPVLLTDQHAALCRVRVGEKLPPLEVTQLDGVPVPLADQYGPAASVIVFWKSDRRMAHDELADLGPDVAVPFGSQGVAVIGIAVEESADQARTVLNEADAQFPNYLDPDGKAFAQVGSQKLPWTLVVDATGRVVWFDIEYSHATRRELRQALLAILR